MTKKIVALAGDGIGPEIMEAGLAVLETLMCYFCLFRYCDTAPIGRLFHRQ